MMIERCVDEQMKEQEGYTCRKRCGASGHGRDRRRALISEYRWQCVLRLLNPE